MFLRVILYTAVISGVMAVIGVIITAIAGALGIHVTADTIGMAVVLGIIYSVIGSVISITMSKTMIKRHMHLTPIVQPQNCTEKWLLETVNKIADKKQVGHPEVCIYNSSEMNAFATGCDRNNALVAVSSALLNNMDHSEVEAVLGHEMSHVSNGDMVTMGLLQGVINAFVYVISIVAVSAARGNRRGIGAYFLQYIFMTVFGFIGNLFVLAFSRWREYHADAGSADVFGANAMIKALEALKGNNPKPEKNDTNMRALYISDESVPNFMAGLLATHPSLDKRIEALKQNKYTH